ncbi:MAG: hypothetical protein R3B70_11480 [Polyangiaceae bacterium]
MTSSGTPGAAPEKTSAYRKGGRQKAITRDLVFDRLPEEVKSRLIEGIAHGVPPAPLLSFPDRAPVRPRVWLGLALLAAVAEALLWSDGFARGLKTPLLSPETAAAAHALAVALIVLTILLAIDARRRLARARPPEGRYLFPLDLVEIRGPHLRVTSLHELSEIATSWTGKKTVVHLRFESAPPLTLDPRGDEAWSAASDAKVQVDKALAHADDDKHLEYVDPFYPLRVQGTWASASTGEGARKRQTFSALVPIAVLALAAGAAAGTGALLAGRLHLRELDDARFEAICKRGDVEALRHHIETGSPRAAAAEEALFEIQKGDEAVLLSHIRENTRFAVRADDELFEIAHRAATVKAYESYLRQGKRHIDEVHTSLLPEAAYGEARKSKKAGDLFEAVHTYPQHPLAAAALKTAHDLYADAFNRYRSAQIPDKAHMEHVKAMLDHLEKQQDPEVALAVSVDQQFTGDWDLGAEARRRVAAAIESAFPHDTVRVSPYNVPYSEKPLFHLRATSKKTGSVTFLAEPTLSNPDEMLSVTVDILRFDVKLTSSVPGRRETLEAEQHIQAQPQSERLRVKSESELRERARAESLGRIPLLLSDFVRINL